MSKRTVDRDGDALVENIAVGADEGRDLGERVELEVLGRRVGRVDLLNLEVEVVGLRDGADGRGAGVELLRRAKISMRGRAKGGPEEEMRVIVRGRCTAFRTPFLRVVER